MESNPTSPWSALQLAEFLAAVSSYEDAATAIRRGLELICEAFESEVGATVFDGKVVETVGFPRGGCPNDLVLAGSSGKSEFFDLQGVGRCDLIVVPLEVKSGNGKLLLARSGAEFSREESSLLAAMARVLSLTLGSLSVLAELRDRQNLLEQMTDEAVHRALHDPLTGLANRTRFFDRLEHALSVRRQADRQVAVLYVDLDDFKQVNDRFGHAAGDKMLRDTAQHLVSSVQEGDTVARIGGDEFAVLIENISGESEAAVTAERVLRSLRRKVREGATEPATSVSVGVATSRPGDSSADELLRNADVAMYRAKNTGKNRLVVFHPEMYDLMLQRIELEIDLRRVIENNELEVFFQPIVRLDDSQTVGVEALARWRHPERGDVPPLTFIPLAEETGLIVDLGAQILTRASAAMGSWSRFHPQSPQLSLSVNVSAFQLQRREFASEVASVLSAEGLEPSSLILEITESVLVQDTEATLTQLRELTQLGVRLAIDDFGTGFSSLSYLHRFPINILKIDRSFVASLRSGDIAVQKLTEAVLVLGETLGLECMAEGVEHIDEAQILKLLGCRFAQGHYFSPPLPEKDLADFLRKGELGFDSLRSPI